MSKKVKVLMAGAGALYPLYMGALLALQDKGYEIVSIAGTSGGSIAAASWSLCDVKKNQKNMLDLVSETLPINNKDVVKYSMTNFVSRWGMVDGANLEKMLSRVFRKKLKESTIPTYIYAATVSRCSDAVFRSCEHGELETAKVIRASCSIPLIFNPTEINGELYVDGGWSNRFPTNVFSHEKDDCEIIAMRIMDQDKTNISSNFVNYVQNILYNRIVRNYEKDNFPDNFYNFDFVTKFDRMKLSKTTEKEAMHIFYEGYNQTKEFINVKRVAQKLD